jgi:hypothetical protein
MEILIPVGLAPTRVGIAQDGSLLRAVSPCCGEFIDFNWNEDYDYNCSKCREEITDPSTRGFHDGPGDDRIQVSSTKTDLTEWVLSWTKFEPSQVNVVKKRRRS